jgi:Ca-activated chloride channel family protein
MKSVANVPRLAAVLAAAALAALWPTAPAAAAYVTIAGARVAQGELLVAEKDRERLDTVGDGAEAVPPPADRFILRETRVEVEISGVLARVGLEQVFQNPYAERLEALYVFPLPEDAAVDGYAFRIGEMVIEGVVKEREEARREYETAREEGRKGALLEQERDDIFSQAVANIPPGAEVSVRIRYVHPVKIDGGRCIFRFPLVVAPRYVPGNLVARPGVGRGWARDTDVVGDASRISPPVLPEGMRSGNDVSIAMKIDAAMPIHGITAVTHELAVEQPEPTSAVIRLQNGPTIANKDFVVEYSLAGEETVLATLTHRGEDDEDGYVALVLQPKRDIAVAELSPREVILLLDRSGSMKGASISQLRVMAGHLLEKLNPQDTFRVIAFDSTIEELRPGEALPATPEHVARGRDFIRALDARNGTEMLAALKHALGSSERGDEESARARHLVIMSDALVGDDDRILGYLGHRRLADVRVFPVAIGAAPNHYLMERAAEIGRGFAMHVTNQDNAAEMAARFSDKTSTPYLTDLELDWGGLGVRDVVPERLPDLHAGEPLVVLARYGKPGDAEITLRGNLAGQEVTTTLKLELPEREPGHDALGAVWARQRIRQLWNRSLGKETGSGRAEITRLGLEHQLVTRYTSFVAVEVEAPAAAAATPLRTESVPTLLPEGMTAAAAPPEAFGARPAGPAPAARGPGPHVPVAPPTCPAPVPAHQPAPGDAPRRGVGFGGAVEWAFLAGLGLLAGSRLVRRRRVAGAR